MLQKGGSLDTFSSEAEGFHNSVYGVLGLLEGAPPESLCLLCLSYAACL